MSREATPGRLIINDPVRSTIAEVRGEENKSPTAEEQMVGAMRGVSLKMLAHFRDTLRNQEGVAFDAERFNALMYKRLKADAADRDALFYAHDRCMVKGHEWEIASEYRGLYCAGVDVPVRCQRCGEMDM